jgi:hypothetical protein
LNGKNGFKILKRKKIKLIAALRFQKHHKRVEKSLKIHKNKKPLKI